MSTDTDGDADKGASADDDPAAPFRPSAVPPRLRDATVGWLMWSTDSDAPRRPHWAGDFGVSWSDPGDWREFADAAAATDARREWGGGVVADRGTDDVDGDLTVIDLDGALNAEGTLREWVPPLDVFHDAAAYIEHSPSTIINDRDDAGGGGLHIPVVGYSPPDWWTDWDDDNAHLGVQVLTNSFVTVTGHPTDDSGDDVLDTTDEDALADAIDSWLLDAYRALDDDPPQYDAGQGDLPAVEATDGTGARDTPDTPDRAYPGLTREQVEDALDHVDESLAYPDWIRLGFAVLAWDDTERGKAVFQSWSETNAKWDASRGQRHIDDLWSGKRDPDGPVGVGTLVYYAKQGGWTPSPPHREAGDGQDDLDADANEADWEDVKKLYASGENGSSTRAAALAATILSEQHAFVTVRDSDAIYHYRSDRGYYVRKGMTFVDELVERHLPEHANPDRLGAIRQKVRARNFVDADEFVPPEGKVNVEDGIIDLDRWAEDPADALEPHSSEYYFTTRLNAEYDPDADDDGLWAKALETAIPDPAERRKVEEYAGHGLETWTTDHEKALWFVGPPGTGKSTIQEAIEALFGDMPTVVALAPHQIADHRFDVAALADAALNTLNDVNGGKIENTGKLKRFISGQTAKLERKYEDAYFGETNSKHLWTANWMPRLVGQDDAIYRRFLLVEFPNKIPDEEQDTEYGKALKTDPAVRSVLLNRALEGRARLREQGGFTNDRSRTETRHLYDSWRDSHRRFLYTQFQLTGDPDDTVERKAYWQAYSEFAGRKGYERKSNQSVTKALQYVPEVDASGDGDTYAGLRWRDRDAADPSQHSRRAKIRTWVEQFSTPRAGAAINDLLAHADERGVDPEAVERDIRNMLEMGELMEPADGSVRLT